MFPETDSRSALHDTAGTCDLCEVTGAVSVLPLGDRSLIRCIRCGLVRLDPRPTPDELSDVYDGGNYYTTEPAKRIMSFSERVRARVLEAFWDYPSARSRFSRAVAIATLWPLRGRAMPVRFPRNAAVLDIGCGNGQRLMEFEAYGHRQLYGIEPTPGAAAQANAATKANIQCCTLEQADLPNRHFGLIIMNQVLEHVPSPTDTLRRVRDLLRDDGCLYLTVPNFGSLEAGVFGRHWSGLQIPAHLHHFAPGPLRRMLEVTGLQIATWRTDTVLAVTAASVRDWVADRPTRWRRAVSRVPRLGYAPLTLMVDMLGRGQMIRVVAGRG